VVDFLGSIAKNLVVHDEESKRREKRRSWDCHRLELELNRARTTFEQTKGAPDGFLS
jgi:hypothetical protein